MTDQEKITNLRVALNDILERATDHPAFDIDAYKARDVSGLVKIGGDTTDWTMVAIIAADALEETK